MYRVRAFAKAAAAQPAAGVAPGTAASAASKPAAPPATATARATASAAAASATLPSDFQLKEMQVLDALLRCGVCHEFFTVPVMLRGCSHNFCSECIRRHLAFQKQTTTYRSDCPICNKEATASDIVPNRILEHIVSTYIPVRSTLRRALNRKAADQPAQNTLTSKPGPLKSGSLPNQAASATAPAPALAARAPSAESSSNNAGGATADAGPSSTNHVTSSAQQRIQRASSASSGHASTAPRPTAVTPTAKPPAPPPAPSREILLLEEEDDDDLVDETSKPAGAKTALKSNHVNHDDDDDDDDFVPSTRPLPQGSVKATPSTRSGKRSSAAVTAENAGENDSGSASDPLPNGRSSGRSPNRSKRFKVCQLQTSSSQASAEDAAARRARSGPEPASSSDLAASWRVDGTQPSPTALGTNEKVPCPVCGQSVPASSVNQHLDKCLIKGAKRGSLRSSNRLSPPPLPPMIQADQHHQRADALAEQGIVAQGDHNEDPMPTEASMGANSPVAPESEASTTLTPTLTDAPAAASEPDQTLSASATLLLPAEYLGAPTERRKPMAKIVYKLMKDKDLRNTLSKLGLPSHGTRKEMIARHEEYSLLYNAQCDALHPLSNHEIIKEVMRREAKQTDHGTKRKLDDQFLATDAAQAPDYIAKQRASYNDAHAKHFRQLIQEARERYPRRLRRPKPGAWMRKRYGESIADMPSASTNT